MHHQGEGMNKYLNSFLWTLFFWGMISLLIYMKETTDEEIKAYIAVSIIFLGSWFAVHMIIGEKGNEKIKV